VEIGPDPHINCTRLGQEWRYRRRSGADQHDALRCAREFHAGIA
jgi:hypothetical protein